MTTTTTYPFPDFAPPAGENASNDWHETDNAYRFVWGENRRVEATDLSVSTCATQLPDGSIEPAGIDSETAPVVCIDTIKDGVTSECLTLSLEGAQSLMAALAEAIAELDRWVAA